MATAGSRGPRAAIAAAIGRSLTFQMSSGFCPRRRQAILLPCFCSIAFLSAALMDAVGRFPTPNRAAYLWLATSSGLLVSSLMGSAYSGHLRPTCSVQISPFYLSVSSSAMISHLMSIFPSPSVFSSLSMTFFIYPNHPLLDKWITSSYCFLSRSLKHIYYKWIVENDT